MRTSRGAERSLISRGGVGAHASWESHPQPLLPHPDSEGAGAGFPKPPRASPRLTTQAGPVFVLSPCCAEPGSGVKDLWQLHDV